MPVGSKFAGLFSSVCQDWRTPQEVYDALDREFHFDFDPCPIDPSFDGLNVEWGQCNFVNPPYKHIVKWIEKAWLESFAGKTTVLLIPSRTDTRYWHDYIMSADEIRFIKGRLRFSGSTNSAPFPSAIVVFRGVK
jgi:site-specific DNA-methyltransferase (adenine-specific)